ncbi:MAG: hypothetical protein ACPIOQ_22960, partial [Promethearchaeia archaeon]
FHAYVALVHASAIRYSDLFEGDLFKGEGEGGSEAEMKVDLMLNWVEEAKKRSPPEDRFQTATSDHPDLHLGDAIQQMQRTLHVVRSTSTARYLAILTTPETPTYLAILTTPETTPETPNTLQ